MNKKLIIICIILLILVLILGIINIVLNNNEDYDHTGDPHMDNYDISFTPYIGDNVDGNMVKSLLNVLKNHNLQSEEEQDVIYIKIYFGDNTEDVSKEISNVKKKVEANKTYNVTANKNENDKIDKLYIKENK